MNKPLRCLIAGAALTLAGSYSFVNPLLAQQRDLGNIFVPADDDSFDPGLPIGAQFPSIRALYQGREISGVDQFMGENGLAFFANRSVDW